MATELSPPNPTGAEIEAAKRALRRARNREAAYKSRAKKSKEISALEEDVQRARTRRTELSMYAEELRSEVFMLKNEILMHCDCDHAPIRQYLRNSISKLQSGLLQGEGSANPPCAGDIDNR
ncbi:hypothetical protein GQ53DRAFT_819686 [Thozetella sp. PMI_491]|nr:hypothetical protein GQ53DRAFT_819686 [Thozetella sp. PMI_491]